MANFMDMMKQAREMQSKMAQMQAEMENMDITGSSGGGLVNIVMNGKGELKGVNIDPSLLADNEAEILEDLLIAAHKDAKIKSEEIMQDKMKDITGDLPLPPGMKLF